MHGECRRRMAAIKISHWTRQPQALPTYRSLTMSRYVLVLESCVTITPRAKIYALVHNASFVANLTGAVHYWQPRCV